MLDLLKYRQFWLKLLVLFCWANLVAAVIWVIPLLPLPVKTMTNFPGLLIQVSIALIGFVYVNKLAQRSYEQFEAVDWMTVAMMLLGLVLLWLSIAMYAKAPKNPELELAVGIIGIIIALFGTTRIKYKG